MWGNEGESELSITTWPRLEPHQDSAPESKIETGTRDNTLSKIGDNLCWCYARSEHQHRTISCGGLGLTP